MNELKTHRVRNHLLPRWWQVRRRCRWWRLGRDVRRMRAHLRPDVWRDIERREAEAFLFGSRHQGDETP